MEHWGQFGVVVFLEKDFVFFVFLLLNFVVLNALLKYHIVVLPGYFVGLLLCLFVAMMRI